MSLINQVLNDLEKRGSDASSGMEAVRAVPASNVRLWLLLLIAVAVLAAALLAKLMHRESISSAPSPSRQIIKLAEPHVAAQSASAVVQALPSANVAPTLQLSFELSSIPLPFGEPPRKREASVAAKPTAEQTREKPKAASAEVQGEYAGQPIKRISPQQQAADEYGQALALIQQGNKGEALPHLEATLRLDPDNVDARLTLAGVLLEAKHNADAERVLQEGLRHDPKQSQLAMLLARLQVERGAMAQALDTLQTTLPFADQRADYHAFVAAVLQRQNRHKEAITHYQIALRLAPDAAIWWMGLGISLQAVDAGEAARDAFKHAADLHKLSPELQTFVEKQLKAPAK